MRRYIMITVGLLLLGWSVGFGRIPLSYANGNTEETPTQEIDPVETGSDERGGSAAIYELNLTRSQFDSLHATYTGQANQLVDVDIRWDGSQERFSAIWFPLPVGSTIYDIIQVPYSEYEDFFEFMQTKDGRFIDVEVGYFDGVKLYSAIFMEDGDDYGFWLRTTNTDAQFQTNQANFLNMGYSIIDFEAYTDSGGDTKYAGVWVKDPNQPQTTLYYGLESADVSDLISPRIGRVIDIERYYSSIHDETRWAMIFAMDSGGEQYQRRGDTASGIDGWDDTFSDSNTHMIDIDSYESGGTVRYIALWGDTYKSLHEVDLISADSDQEQTPAAVSNLITQFENAAGPAVIGVYAKNVRTNQSIAYRADEPFYLASTAKIPIHIKYWREVQNAQLNAGTLISYTSGLNSRAPWYTEIGLAG